MSAADWYARKLGGQQQQAPRSSTPPTGPVAYQPPAYVPPYQPATPYGQPQAPQQVAPGPPKLTKDNAVEIMLTRPDVWQGRGLSVKAGETHACPSCGSNHFFSRVGQSKMNASGISCAPAPVCDSCGYNGLYEQFGSKLVED